MLSAQGTGLVPIGRFSRLTRLSIKALRHYDELGLLCPARVDEASGYRYYQLAQSRDAERIRLLRAVEMPLDEIRAVLASGSGDEVRAMLARHRARLAERMAELAAAAEELDRLILRSEPDGEYVGSLRDAPRQCVASVREDVPPRVLLKWIGRAFFDVYRHLYEADTLPAGPGLQIFHAEDPEDLVARVEVCVPIAVPIASCGRIQVRELGPERLACVTHHGAYEGLDGARRALMGWIDAQELEITGPLRETYVVGPAQVQDAAQLRTEVAWPVR